MYSTARKLYFLQSQAFAIMVNVTKPLKGIANLAPLRNPLLEDANLALSDEKDSSSTPSGVVDKSSPVAVSSESATHISQPLVDDSASSSAMAPSGVCVEEKEESLDQELIRLVDFAMLTNDTAKRIALMGAVLQPNEPEDMQQLGGILFSIINLLLPYIAGKLVGMILEQDYDQILLLLSDSVQLASSIRMCLKVIINDEKYGCCFNPGGYCQYGMHWPGSRMPACPHYVIGSRHRGAAIHIENYIRYKKQAATLHALGHRSDKKCGSDVTAKSTTQPSTRRLVLGRGIAPGGTLEELKMDTAPVRGWGMSSEATMTMQEIQAAQELLLSEYDSANTYQLKTFTGLSAGNMQKRKKLQKEKLAAEAVESAARKARIAVHVAKLDATRAERNKVHSLKPVSSYSYTFMPPNKRSPVPSSRAGVFGNRDGRSHLCRNRGVAKFEWELREDDFEDFNPVGEPQHSGYACVQIDRKGKECRKNNCYETWHMCHGCKRRTLMQQGKFEKGEGNAPNPTLLAQAREKKTIKDACKYSHMTNLYFKNQYRNIEAGLTHLENKLLKTTNPREVRELQDSIDHLHALRYHLPDLDEPVKVSAPADEKAGRKTLRARPSPLVWTMNPLLMKLASSPVAPKKLLSSRMVVVYRTVKGRGVRPVTVRSSKSVQGAPPLTVMSSIAEGIEIVEDDVSLQSSQDCHDINSVMFMFEAHVSGALPEIKVSEVVPADYMLLADYDPETFTHHRTTRYKIKNKTRYMNSPQTDCTARLDQFICPKCAVKKGLDRKIVYTGTSPLFDAKWYANQIQLVNLGVSSMVAGMKGVSPNTSRHIENTTKIALYREHLTFFIAEQARAAKFESV